MIGVVPVEHRKSCHEHQIQPNILAPMINLIQMANKIVHPRSIDSRVGYNELNR